MTLHETKQAALGGTCPHRNWLREAINDSQTNKASTKRVAMLLATGSLALSVVVLSGAAIVGYDVAASLGAVAIPLAGLGGYSYVGGKNAEMNKSPKENQACQRKYVWKRPAETSQ